MPVIQVDWWEGNDRDRRAELVAELTAAVTRIAHCPAEAVTVLVRDVERGHWGKGGRLADEPDTT
jgi:4-oxalocrotonate tautomerase